MIEVKRPKYLPAEKSVGDLFNQSEQIKEGPAFDQEFGEQKDYDIYVEGGNGKCPLVRYVSS